MLDGVHPTGERRSWWLREALVQEAARSPEFAAPSAAPPLRGTATADVVVVGGGYTGMWAAYRLTELTSEQVGARVRSPVFRGGVFMPGAATIQPAVLARGLRRVLLERGVVIHEGSRVEEIDGQRPGWIGALGADARMAPTGRGAAGGPRHDRGSGGDW